MGLHKKIAMRCTKEQFENIRPKLDGKYVFDSNIFEFYGDLSMSKSYLVNFYCDEERINFSRFTKGREIHEEWDEEIFLEACGISENYKITKETILKYNMKDEFPEVFKPRLEVGKWYKDVRVDSKAVLYLEEITTHKTSAMKSYGFSMKGEWIESCNRSILVFVNFTEKATPEEVELALIREAKKIGLIDGSYIESTSGVIGKLNEGVYIFDYRLNKLYYSGYEIFDNGKWATIIPSITKEEAEKKLNCKII